MSGKYPEVEKSLRKISFQVSEAYRKQPTRQRVQYQPINLGHLQYDFALERGILEVFDKEKKKREIVEESERESAEESGKRKAPPIPPRPQLDRKHESEQADSGVSSGGENGLGMENCEVPDQVQPGTSPQFSSQLLMPTTRQQMPGQMPRPIPKSEASVIDIFDYSRDDPFERVQMNAIDDMAELRDVLEKSQTPPSENKVRPTPKPRANPNPATSDSGYISEIQSILDARKSKNQLERKQNFSKSAMAAMNSLPVIESLPSVTTKPVKPRTPDPTFPEESSELAALLVEMGYDKFVVAKAIALFSNDEDRCIDYLSAYTELVSLGHSPPVVLSTLNVCEFSLEETKIFLKKSPRYLEMGFDHRAVRNALIRYPNEPQLQLESLMMGRT